LTEIVQSTLLADCGFGYAESANAIMTNGQLG
jgi:hypothetical protein